MRRQKHSLSHYRLFTGDLGELIPVGLLEVLPGDTIQMASSALIRSSPLNTPVMHPVSVRIHHWFVPNRIVWDNWENFITGGTDGLGNGAVYPTITGPNPTVQGSLIDYLGIPSGVNAPVFSALPVRAYQLIYRENYRDQDLVTAPVISTADGNDTTTSTTLQKIAWEKDQFTAARPWAQKGPQVTMPLGTSAPVVGNNDIVQGFSASHFFPHLQLLPDHLRNHLLNTRRMPITDRQRHRRSFRVLHTVLDHLS